METLEQMMSNFEWIVDEIKRCILQVENIPRVDEILIQLRSLLKNIENAVNSPKLMAVTLLLQNAVTGFLTSNTVTTDVSLSKRYKDCHLLVLKGLENNEVFEPDWTRRKVTRYLIQHHQGNEYNLKLVDQLVSCNLVDMVRYDIGLVMLMKDGLNSLAVDFAMKLVQFYCIDRGIQSFVSVIHLSSTIKALTLMAANPMQAPDGLTTLIQDLHKTDGKFGALDEVQGEPTAIMQASIPQALSIDDPPGLQGKMFTLLSEWVNMLMWLTPDREFQRSLAFAAFMRQADQLCILQTDDLITRFFRLCTETFVDSGKNETSQKFLSSILKRCYFAWDAYAHLMFLLVKHSGGITNTTTKINLLNKMLGIVAGVLLRDPQGIQTKFHQLLYHRIFIKLFIELNAAEPILEKINFQVLTTFCNLLHVLKPTNAPGFANAWLNLMSHKVFMKKMLVYTSEKKVWKMFAQLLIDLFKFMSPFLTNACLENQIQMLHKNTCKLLLDILHDFPEFLCEYHHDFCDAMSPDCMEMRNLILSASPRNIPVSNPLTSGLMVDLLPEIVKPPCISASFANMIQTAHFKKDLDSYLKTRLLPTFLSSLVWNLKPNEEPDHGNVRLISLLVLYVGTQAIDCINRTGLAHSMSTIVNLKHTEFFDDLLHGLDETGRYLFLTAIFDQLTYPNSHTHYFSCLLVYLFNKMKKEEIHEQITKLVMKRLANNHLYPWGLLITVIELLKNPIFEYLSLRYIHSFPDIEKLFASVARLHKVQVSNAIYHTRYIKNDVGSPYQILRISKSSILPHMK